MSLFARMGGEEGCRRLSRAFYDRVALDPVLRPLFPGKSLRCAREEMAAFLIQFFGGDEGQTQYRWWLSLKESHQRFRISAMQKEAWLRLMGEALADAVPDKEAQAALAGLFLAFADDIFGEGAGHEVHPDLADSWRRHLALEDVARNLAEGNDQAALAGADGLADRPSVLVGILARMMVAGRPALLEWAAQRITDQHALCRHRFNGRSLLHHACSHGRVQVVEAALKAGADPNEQDAGGHAPLYRAAAREGGADVARLLVAAGADPNHAGGVMRATALHEAARHGGMDVLRALLELGADDSLTDARGFTPLQRAVRCRRREAARLLEQHGQGR